MSLSYITPCFKNCQMLGTPILLNRYMAEVKRIHLLISGRVQGVFFRANAKKMADLLRIKGWVKNLTTGEVELYAIGTEEQLKKMIEWSHQGPPRARVTKVDVLWGKNLGDFNSFEVV